jgi:hypothetical protein
MLPDIGVKPMVCKIILIIQTIMLLFPAAIFSGLLKGPTFILGNYDSRDTIGILYPQATILLCVVDSVQGIRYYTGNEIGINCHSFIDAHNGTSGFYPSKPSLESKFNVNVRIYDTTDIYDDAGCTNIIGKIWHGQGVLAGKGDFKNELLIRGKISMKSLVERKPWQHLLSISNIEKPFTLSRNTINLRLNNAGIYSSYSLKDHDYIYDYFFMGCNRDVTIAIFLYLKSSLVAFWTDEKITIKRHKKVSGKWLYYLNDDAENRLKERICEDLRKYGATHPDRKKLLLIGGDGAGCEEMK